MVAKPHIYLDSPRLGGDHSGRRAVDLRIILILLNDTKLSKFLTLKTVQKDDSSHFADT